MVICKAALDAADAGTAVKRNLKIARTELRVPGNSYALKDFDRLYLLSIGKAAGRMALAVEEVVGSRLTGGLMVTKHGHAVKGLNLCRQRFSGHPIPDRHGLNAAVEIEQLLRQLNARDLLLVAISGGASALLPSPAPGLTLAAKQKTTDLLLRAGADIGQLNAVRKHLSTLKGGGLAALAYPATVIGLLLSDVIGDPLDVIGSGPAAPDRTTYADALHVLDQFGLLTRIPVSVRRHLELGAEGKKPETPKAGDPIFANVQNVIIGSNWNSLQAAEAAALTLGYSAAILSSAISGETREAAAVLSTILREVVQHGAPLRPPACLLAGGETTVTVRAKGQGGRNQEFALSAAHALKGLPGVLVLSLGTDGTDGPTDAAGAIATGSTIARAEKLGLDAARALKQNDAYPFFQKLGDLVKTGPTGTNVMDICVFLAAAQSS